MEDFVDELTRGNVSQVKTVLASIVVALAGYQVFLMAVGYRKLKLPFLKGKPASFTHRAVGDTIVLITVLVAYMCLSYFEIGMASNTHEMRRRRERPSMSSRVPG